MSKKAEEDTEKNAWRFVDLVFTGQRSTEEQDANFDNLVNDLKHNEIALKYIDIDIQKLIYIVATDNNKKLNKIFDKCYDTLETLETIDKLDPLHELDLKKLIRNNLPFYLKELKKLTDSESQELYNNVVTSYKRYYGIIIKKRDSVNINERVDDLEQRVENNSINAKKNITKAENNIKKELYPEFITLLGIFTAITFAIFGGMNLLSNLFQNLRSTHASLGQALILASIFGFTVLGIIEILFIWISKINLTKVDKDNRKDKKEDCSGSDRTCINKKCLNKNCSNIDCSNEICLNKDCSNAIDKEEIKIVKHKKIFYWFALSFLTVILILGFRLFFF